LVENDPFVAQIAPISKDEIIEIIIVVSETYCIALDCSNSKGTVVGITTFVVSTPVMHLVVASSKFLRQPSFRPQI
jgi:hypothetical protein